jgi:nicotinate dehydrogenase subunit A
VVELTVNGVPQRIDAADDISLLYALRGPLGLAGPRFGCGQGMCGACMVLVDGRPVTSCDMPLRSVAGAEVTTVEGLATDGVLHPLQQAFLDEQAAQCGYCTSGILVRAAALLAANPTPDEDAVVTALDDNLCRCGIQRRVVRAVLRAAAGAQR